MQKAYRLTKDEFYNIYAKVPKLTVEVVVHTDQGVLLTLRTLPSWHGLWHIPGGTVLYGETVQHAVKRIAKDELGIGVSVEKLLGYIEYPSEIKERGFGSTVGLAFLCRPLSMRIKINNDASDAKFFSSLPKNIVVEQKRFLKASGLVRDTK